MRSAIARRRAVATAGHLGDAAGARQHLDDHDPLVRASALRALQRARALSADELGTALRDPAPEVRMTALELAANRHDVALAEVAPLLDDADRRVVEVAAWSCGEKAQDTDDTADDTASDTDKPTGNTDDDGAAAGAPEDLDSRAAVVQALGSLAVSHEDPLCRESAIAALGAIADPAGLAAILQGLHDRPAIRRRAVIALAPFDGPVVDAALSEASRDRDKQVRAAVAELLDAGR